MHVQPYLFFDGRCHEALDFYRDAVGAEVAMLLRFADAPAGPQQDQAACMPENAADKVMHAQFRIGDTEVMASDGRCTGTPHFEGFALTLTAADATEADRLFAALGDGGEVRMPLEETFFSPRFGMVADRFGVTWMIIVPATA